MRDRQQKILQEIDDVSRELDALSRRLTILVDELGFHRVGTGYEHNSDWPGTRK
jgi:hypothetical protein